MAHHRVAGNKHCFDPGHHAYIFKEARHDQIYAYRRTAGTQLAFAARRDDLFHCVLYDAKNEHPGFYQTFFIGRNSRDIGFAFN